MKIQRDQDGRFWVRADDGRKGWSISQLDERSVFDLLCHAYRVSHYDAKVSFVRALGLSTSVDLGDASVDPEAIILARGHASVVKTEETLRFYLGYWGNKGASAAKAALRHALGL